MTIDGGDPRLETVRVAAEEAANDAGIDFWSVNREALLTEVHREASKRYANKNEIIAFVDGFTRSRLLHDGYLREKRETQ